MKFENVLVLTEWAKANADYLRSPDRPPLTELAPQVSAKLGFKVNADNLRKAMTAAGIPTKRQSKSDAKIVALQIENERLVGELNNCRQIIAKVYVSDLIPDDMKDYILAGLPQEMRSALQQEVE